jgi:hypothetical protein
VHLEVCDANTGSIYGRDKIEQVYRESTSSTL